VHSKAIIGRTWKRGSLALFIMLVLGLAVGGCLTAGFVCYKHFEPEEVRVTFVNIPRGTHYYCVVADTPDGLEPMNWSATLIFRAVTPAIPGAGERGVDWPPEQEAVHCVIWRTGRRYGVVQWRFDGTWWVTWFDPSSPEVEHRKSFWDRGAITFDLAKGNTQRLPEEKGRALIDFGSAW
jgi:hypothetical protein